jgi:hypothetical protein
MKQVDDPRSPFPLDREEFKPLKRAERLESDPATALAGVDQALKAAGHNVKVQKRNLCGPSRALTM